MIEALSIQVKGIVQGVGFRPFVYKTAKKYLINGWVLNAIDGVTIHAEGESKLLDEFVLELSDNAPAAAQVREIELKEVPLEPFDSFEIRYSDDAATQETTLVSPDLAMCPDCERELLNPNDRRFRYPFINCTNCGPRFTIIEQLPYDRKHTSMKDFPLCPRCAAEYDDPLNRRFHAQPNACFECGPQISWREHQAGPQELPAVEQPLGQVSWGATRRESDAILARAVALLQAGGIVAVKGLGGFHLVCDANDPAALAKLRQRKHRQGKAFAVMMRDVDAVRCVCQVSDAERALLEGAQRPIVLLRKRADVALAAGLADGLPELGVMLPYTPVQRLLLEDFAAACDGPADVLPMLVMTSGNVHDEPIVTDDEAAYGALAAIADGFLGNNRAIRSRYDDSVVRVIQAGSAGEAVQMVRRARGYAPVPLAMRQAELPDAAASLAGVDLDGETRQGNCLFATGPEQKNAFALVRGGQAFVSQHIGDMENAETYDAWLEAKARYQTLFEADPQRVACDLHPEYLSSKWAAQQGQQGVPVQRVQHHHAHIASVLGEHNLTDAVCGIAFDGTGFGTDGRIWGGEVLLANQQAFERFANFAYVPMPGGAAAVKNPLRMAYGALWAFDLLDHPAAQPALEALGSQAQVCGQMIDRGLNTPATSSVGRLFDAASALLGICTQPTYEGEPAIMLEAALTQPLTSDFTGKPFAMEAAGMQGAQDLQDDQQAAARYAVNVVKNTASADSTAQDTSVVLLDAAQTFQALLDDTQAGIPVSVIARRFHNAFVEAMVLAAQLANSLYGISTVALSGGVFMNRYLLEHALAALEKAGFTVAVNRDLPPNDGCVSYGQAVVACATNDETA